MTLCDVHFATGRMYGMIYHGAYSATVVVFLDRSNLFDIFRNMEMISVTSPTPALEAEQVHADAFKALSHKTRLSIFYYLVQKGEAGDTVGNLQEAIDVPWATLSHHLDVLRRAELLASRRKERFIYYRVIPEQVGDLVRLLTACC